MKYILSVFKVKAVRILIITICCIILVVIINPFSISAYYNNYKLNRYEKRVYNISLPPNTHELSRYSEVGGIYGNGDGCDFLVQRKIVSKLKLEEIIKFYKEEIPKESGNVEIQIKINFIEEVIDGNIYELELFDEANNPLFDLRCT